MPETVTLQVTRYRPEIDPEPVFQEYQVPLHADWVVLDALNYIKDNVDGTLSYRWSCRMGICGSCGMTVNGEPKLTCATFLVESVPAAIALAQRYNLDSRDGGAKERREVLSTHDGIWGCTLVGECTRVCPKNVDPAGAIQRYKLTAALEELKGFLTPWRAR